MKSQKQQSLDGIVTKCLAIAAVAYGCSSSKTDSFSEGYNSEKGKIAARSEKADADKINRLEDAVCQFRVDANRYPTTKEGLEALLVQPDGANGWKGPYCKIADLEPESGKSFSFESSGENFSIKLIPK